MHSFAQADLLRACRVLFGSEPAVGQDFLLSLSLACLKGAYRRRALQIHPDLHAHRQPHVQQRYALLFQELTGGYRLLCRYLEQQGRLRGAGRAASSGGIAKGNAGNGPPSGDQGRPPAFGAVHGRPGPPAAAKHRPRNIPPWRMRLGEYLYHSGQISWKALIDALVLQRRERPRLGDIAQRWGWLTEERILALLRRRRPGERIGDLFVRCRLMTAFRLGMLLSHQRRHCKPIGGYFIKAGLLSPACIQANLLRQSRHNSQYAR